LWPSQIKKLVARAERSNEPSTTARQTDRQRQTPPRSHQQKSLKAGAPPSPSLSTPVSTPPTMRARFPGCSCGALIPSPRAAFARCRSSVTPKFSPYLRLLNGPSRVLKDARAPKSANSNPLYPHSSRLGRYLSLSSHETKSLSSGTRPTSFGGSQVGSLSLSCQMHINPT
jgi:hypothetical protein